MPSNTDDLRAFLPQKVINQYKAEQARQEDARGGHRRHESEAAERVPKSGIELHWCGSREAVLLIVLDGESLGNRWRPEDEGMVRVPALVGSHVLQVNSIHGDPVRSLEVNVHEKTWSTVNIGHLYDNVVAEPSGRSQFSFEDGRSACSFLCCHAAQFLCQKLSSTEDGISCAEIHGEDIASVLSQGMQKFSEQGKAFIEAAGLEHVSTGEVLDLCGAVWDGQVRAADDGSFFGILTEEASLHDSLREAVAVARKQGARRRGPAAPLFITLTRPPETLLIVVLEDAKLYGVLDTHTRFVGSAQHPAGWYTCGSLPALADLLRATFVPLPAGLHPEELGAYAMFELTVLDVQRISHTSRPRWGAPASGVDVSDELDPDAVLL